MKDIKELESNYNFYGYPDDISKFPDYKYDIQCNNGCHVHVAILEKKLDHCLRTIYKIRSDIHDIDRVVDRDIPRSVIKDFGSIDEAFRISIDQKKYWNKFFPECTSECMYECAINYSLGDPAKHKSYTDKESQEYWAKKNEVDSVLPSRDIQEA